MLTERENIIKRLATPIQFVKGVGPKLSAYLGKLGLNTVEDLFYHLPFRYEDRRKLSKIVELKVGEPAVFIAKVVDYAHVKYGFKRAFDMVVADDSGSIALKWFKPNPSLNSFKRGDNVVVVGTVRSFNYTRELHHPEIRSFDGEDLENIAGIIPVYSQTEGLKQQTLRRVIKNALTEHLPFYLSPLDADIAKNFKLPDGASSIKNLHFPEKTADIVLLNSFKSSFHKRIIFEELFYFGLVIALKRMGNVLQKGIKFEYTQSCISELKKVVPFTLTSAQDKVIQEVSADMQSSKPMNRLIQGDVGSGKTIVAFFAVYAAARNGYQAAIMAPTEILANQHYKNLARYFDELKMSAALLTNALGKKEKETVIQKVKDGEIDVIIGTHAVIQNNVQMKRLGLIVIDEQHKFGVMQRASLIKKAGNIGGALPHMLIMTATPIPRTLAITVYGDLDVSVIDQMPPGRKPVITKVFYESERNKVYDAIRREIKAGKQAYIVYPLVSESEVVDLKDATRMAEHLSADIFPEFRVGLLHGRLKDGEKENIMRMFKEHQLDVLVATTVIEVGIDIPTASIMVVEHAERFGLSQLHQLRGRVGRGSEQSKCILLAQYKKSEEAKRRLKVMEQTNDGFKIAEEDLAIRGPGEMLGTRQSGLPDFQVASLIRDLPILSAARQEAFALVKADPKLEKTENQLIKAELIRRMKGKLELASIG